MQVSKLQSELDFCLEDSPIYVEINGVVHDVHYIRENSQGVTLFVDTDQEEREMR